MEGMHLLPMPIVDGVLLENIWRKNVVRISTLDPRHDDDEEYS